MNLKVIFMIIQTLIKQIRMFLNSNNNSSFKIDQILNSIIIIKVLQVAVVEIRTKFHKNINKFPKI